MTVENKKNLITPPLLIGGIVLIVASFVGGYFVGRNKITSNPIDNRQFSNIQMGDRNGQARGNMGQGVRNIGYRPVVGEVISLDESSITVKSVDGSSRILLLSDKTSINKSTQATVDDIKVGENISSFGQENADGSVSAQSIELNPVLRGQEIKQ